MKSVTFQPNLLIYVTSFKDSIYSILSMLKCTFIIFKHLLRCLRGLTLQFSLETPWGYHSRVMGLWQLMNVMKDINRTSLIIDECYGGALPQMQIHHIVFAFLGNGWTLKSIHGSQVKFHSLLFCIP